MKNSVICLLSAFALFTLSSCQTHTQNGALVGGLGGAAIGAMVADDSAKGALIGGAIGAASGAAVGSAKDKNQGYRY